MTDLSLSLNWLELNYKTIDSYKIRFYNQYICSLLEHHILTKMRHLLSKIFIKLIFYVTIT